MIDLVKSVESLLLSVSVDLEKASRMLTQDEGKRNYPYDDATGKSVFCTGKLSIGIGRNLEANPLSDLEISIMLLKDIGVAEVAAKRIVGTNLFNKISENRKLALINLIFNMGETTFRTFQNTIAAIKQEKWAYAAQRLLESKYATQVKERSKRVASMLKDDLFPYK